MLETVAAFFGTIAFSLLFGVPARYDLLCGLSGMMGWIVYSLLTGFAGLSPAMATLGGALVVTLLSRFLSVPMKCPATVFLITGIFPLVPGAGIYWTSYYIVTGQLSQALSSGFSALKVAVALVLGIVFVFEIPERFFHRFTVPRR